MTCAENPDPDELDREKLLVQPTCKETPKVPGQMICAGNIGPDEHNKETPNMGLDKEKLPVQPTCEETPKVTGQMTSAENIGPDEHNKETPNMGLGEEKLPVQLTCAENIGPDEQNEETPNMDLNECDEGNLQFNRHVKIVLMDMMGNPQLPQYLIKVGNLLNAFAMMSMTKKLN